FENADFQYKKLAKLQTKEKPLISIIVPIYNVEKYLRECLDSIVNQTYTNLEIILVNDGSTDNCGRICDEYATKDKRIKVIHKENAGLGAAYNTGLEISKGEYIGFVESDDWIELNMYEELYNKAEELNSDLVKCKFFDYNSTRKPKDLPYRQKRIDFELENCCPDNKTFSILEYPKLLIYHSSIWATLYHKDLISRIRFNELKGAAYPDFSFMMQALLIANNISTLRKALYHYRQEPANMSSMKKTDISLLKMIEQCSYAREKLVSLNIFDKIREEFYSHAIASLHGFYYRIEDDLKPLFFQKLVDFFCSDSQKITCKYFHQHEKDFLLCILDKDYSRTLIHNGAVWRIKNHLTYKLGFEVKHSKTKLLLPFKLIKITIKHYFQKFIFNIVCGANPYLKLPPIYGYADYYKALQIQKSEIYQLGKRVMKNPFIILYGRV
ncbi:glycosyltransferase family 2 protein, partial [Campylobacter sp. MIT 19-121]|uniref:glycosyltransferase family 2 protein n=1 Tax=Campylobacter sp. MIT 19-121 TaxID=2703906 RepID=UPI00192EB090